MNRTPAQIDAARRNGARSRGPLTPEGKARSSANSTKHGLHSAVVVLNNESEAAYRSLIDRLILDHDPVTPAEHALIAQLGASTWRLNRLLNLETAAIDYEVDRQRTLDPGPAVALDEATRTHLAVAELVNNGRVLHWYSRHEARLLRSIRDTQAQLAKCRANRSPEDTPPPTPECKNEPGATPECANEPERAAHPGALPNPDHPAHETHAAHVAEHPRSHAASPTTRLSTS